MSASIVVEDGEKLTGGNQDDQNGEQHDVRSDTGHSKDGTQDCHRDQEEGERRVELGLVEAIRNNASLGVETIRSESRGNRRTKGEPETSKDSEHGGRKGVAEKEFTNTS